MGGPTEGVRQISAVVAMDRRPWRTRVACVYSPPGALDQAQPAGDRLALGLSFLFLVLRRSNCSVSDARTPSRRASRR